MADISIICAQCGTVVTVSEFVHDDAVVCHECGTQLEKPGDQGNGRRIKVRYRPPPPPAITEPVPGEEEALEEESRKQEDENVRKHRFAQRRTAWVVVFVLAAGSAFLRYGGILPDRYLQGMIRFGPLVMFLMHIWVVLRAFKDSVFEGILCLLVPFYSLYYVLAVTDEFFMRAVILGLLPGLGYDSAVYYQQEGSRILGSVSEWIKIGGAKIELE